ncbi:hypothetical protein C7N43_04295 [Sphingobacteriales bacterium UPWRP_1]|nr:hypothetical protein B6N25_04840 [Sphingobacteriales bacterium TSM_CSS]PSJ78287.1 hypothetical protein C7N43_04295 [Sphingobacteriales bacterium UPWRP_1]
MLYNSALPQHKRFSPPCCCSQSTAKGTNFSRFLGNSGLFLTYCRSSLFVGHCPASFFMIQGVYLPVALRGEFICCTYPVHNCNYLSLQLYGTF